VIGCLDARDIENVQYLMAQDPYVKAVLLAADGCAICDRRSRTQDKGGTSPQWDAEELQFGDVDVSAAALIRFDIMNENAMADELIGSSDAFRIDGIDSARAEERTFELEPTGRLRVRLQRCATQAPDVPRIALAPAPAASAVGTEGVTVAVAAVAPEAAVVAAGVLGAVAWGDTRGEARGRQLGLLEAEKNAAEEREKRTADELARLRAQIGASPVNGGGGAESNATAPGSAGTGSHVLGLLRHTHDSDDGGKWCDSERYVLLDQLGAECKNHEFKSLFLVSEHCPRVIFHKMVGYAVKFISACLNARTDGTIYFGVAEGCAGE
jgi:hypothetical protein